MIAKERHRLRFPFWLDMKKPEEQALADTIELLKNERTFTRTIRDGIRLIVDLRAGRLDVLFELFPWVKSEFLEYTRSLNGNGDSETSNDVRQQLKRLELLILEQGNIGMPPPDYPVMKPVTNGNGGLKPLPGLKPVEKPTFDDDDLPLAVKKDTSSDAGRNLINSMMGLQ